MKLAGVVVFYNPDNNVAENINTYLKKVDKLYIVDNSIKSDNSSKLPKSKKIDYINNNDNLGIAKALNIACKKAIKDGFEWILTMDQDSKFKGNNLDKMIDYILENDCNKIGIVSPYHLIETNVKRSKLKIEHPIEVMTSGNLLNLKAYQDIKGFKDWLFIDCVDIELCMNLRVHGYDIIRLNYAELEHHLGDSKVIKILWKSTVCSNHSAIRRYYISRNLHYIYDMYYDYFPDYCSMILGGVYSTRRNILLFEKNKFKKIRNIYRGIRDYKKGIKGKYPYNN